MELLSGQYSEGTCGYYLGYDKKIKLKYSQINEGNMPTSKLTVMQIKSAKPKDKNINFGMGMVYFYFDE